MHMTKRPQRNWASPGLDLWYDDIAIGTERIGCN